jgi:transcriptional regulator with XRE-family HTH domain
MAFPPHFQMPFPLRENPFMASGELKVWRERHGFTQSQAANALGISINDVANYEHNERRSQRKPQIKIKDKIQSNGLPRLSLRKSSKKSFLRLLMYPNG